jgi:hypothetical protein
LIACLRAFSSPTLPGLPHTEVIVAFMASHKSICRYWGFMVMNLI